MRTKGMRPRKASAWGLSQPPILGTVFPFHMAERGGVQSFHMKAPCSSWMLYRGRTLYMLYGPEVGQGES